VVAAQEELQHAMPQVMAMLEDLVMREASGVLEVMGIPSGVIYLDGGRIAYARASWVPGLAARLRAIAPSLSGTAAPEPTEDANDAESARVAVRHGYLTTAGLSELIGSVVAEAFAVLTVPLAPDSSVAGVRFTPIPVHWTDLFPRLGVDAVLLEAARQAERMAACGLTPTTAVAPCDLAAQCAVLTREQWAAACQIGERTTASELALRSGASLADTLHCLGSLVRTGLCVPVWAGGRGHAAAVRRRAPLAVRLGLPAASDTAPSVVVPALGATVAAVPAPTVPEPELMEERLPPRARVQAWPRHASQDQAPSAELLRRVLNGLLRLS
jgi:hypothetical protein